MSIHWCGSCKEECDLHIVNEGIGHYEFWGQRCNDVSWAAESDCCSAAVYENEMCTVEVDADEYKREAKEEALIAKWEERREDY